MISSRSWFLTAAGAICALALAAPAAQAATIGADADAPAAAPASGHQGLAFTPTFGAKARIVEPDGRVVKTDGASDLVSPSSITERRVHTAIAKLVRTEAPARRRITETMTPSALQAP